MTAKDYVLLASVFASVPKDQRNHVWSTLVARMAERLKDTNPQFNAARFMDACEGVK